MRRRLLHVLGASDVRSAVRTFSGALDAFLKDAKAAHAIAKETWDYEPEERREAFKALVGPVGKLIEQAANVRRVFNKELWSKRKEWELPEKSLVAIVGRLRMMEEWLGKALRNARRGTFERQRRSRKCEEALSAMETLGRLVYRSLGNLK